MFHWDGSSMITSPMAFSKCPTVRHLSLGLPKIPPIIKRGTGKYPINGNSNGKVIELNGVFPLTSPFFLVKSCQIPSNQHKTVFFHGFLPTFGPRCGARSWCFRFWRVHRKGSGTSSHPDLGKEAFGWEKHRKKKHKKSIFNECASSLPTRLIMSDVEMSDLSEVKVFQKRWWLNDGWMWTISCPQPRPPMFWKGAYFVFMKSPSLSPWKKLPTISIVATPWFPLTDW